MRMPEWLKTSVATVTFTAVLFAYLNLRHSNEEQKKKQIELADNCTPSDEGEIAVLRIRNNLLECEKHEVLHIEARDIPPMQCPIKGKC